MKTVFIPLLDTTESTYVLVFAFDGDLVRKLRDFAESFRKSGKALSGKKRPNIMSWGFPSDILIYEAASLPDEGEIQVCVKGGLPIKRVRGGDKPYVADVEFKDIEADYASYSEGEVTIDVDAKGKFTLCWQYTDRTGAFTIEELVKLAGGVPEAKPKYPVPSELLAMPAKDSIQVLRAALEGLGNAEGNEPQMDTATNLLERAFLLLTPKARDEFLKDADVAKICVPKYLKDA